MGSEDGSTDAWGFTTGCRSVEPETKHYFTRTLGCHRAIVNFKMLILTRQLECNPTNSEVFLLDRQVVLIWFDD
jgi:hypothetical protein